MNLAVLDTYQIGGQIYESSHSVVYKAQRKHDQQPVVLKMLKEDTSSPERIAWFQREYEVTRDLDVDGVIQVYGLEVVQDRWVMVLEDFGGESLKHLNVAGKMRLDDLLQVAIQIADNLGQIHQRHVVHKDISPANIVAVPPHGSEADIQAVERSEETASQWRVKLIDFGIATVLSRENTTFRNPNGLEGTLPYISPEQTGRMNQAVDYRTDFYSLGATLYELLLGHPPFDTIDPLALIHSHIAKQPIFPATWSEPSQQNAYHLLSEVILKLMAKNAENRYQSAYGLKIDLQQCLTLAQNQSSTGDVEAKQATSPYELGQYDVPDQFRIPQKLYGRAADVETLLTAFDSVVKHQQASFVLVGGYSGIGKSALVREVYKPDRKSVV